MAEGTDRLVVDDDLSTAATAAVAIIAEAMAAFERGDLDALTRFVHPDAEIEMIALDGDTVLGPGGLRDALEQQELHRPSVTRIEPLGDDAALLIGRIQYGGPGRGGVTDRKAVWLTVLRDGMIWRSRVCRTPAHARSLYAELQACR